MFPARAGMSLAPMPHLPRAISVPRASGDEPDYSIPNGDLKECSPRERG